jgi:putative ABC transport system substrate-binding protein
MQFDRLRRREFIRLLGGAAAAWPLAARAQQPERMRRIGVLMSVADGPEGQARLGAFLKGLEHLGWIDDRNVQVDRRWGAGDPERARTQAAELVALGPDVILASGDHSVVAARHATRTVPIVFTVVSDPVGTGYVETLARPGGNMTGFTLFEYSTSAKLPGAAQGDRARREKSGGCSGSRDGHRDRPVRRHSSRGAGDGRRAERNRRARRRRD